MRFNKVMSAALFASAFSIISCSQIDELDGQSQNSAKNTLQISVTDAGVYGDSPSRAVEDGYKTTFEVGDAIGVYGVKGGTLLVENKKFTLQEDGTWEVLGSPIQFVEEEMGDTKFYAYYPYNSNGVNFNTQVGIGGDPFAKTVESWNIGTDQEDENYTQYDLMTSNTTDITPSGALGKVNFVLNHRMSIAAISLPGKVYNFNNTETTIDPYTLPATPGEFKVKQGAENEKVIKPFYDKKNGLYRILVKPNVEYTISGTYVLEKKKEYTSTRTAEGSIEGKAVKFNIKGAIETAHTLQVGDYYCADGSIVGKDETVPSNAIGVVIYVGNPQPSANGVNGTPLDILYNEYNNSKHGLVIALKNSVYKNVEKTKFGNSSSVLFGGWLASDDTWGGRLIGNATNTSIPGFMGYNNTRIMEIASDSESPKTGAAACLDAWNFLQEFRKNVIVPENVATPWFIPSTSEFNEVNKSLVEIINPKLEAAGGQKLVNINADHYWTSTERSSNMGMEYAYDVATGKCDLFQRNRGGTGFPGYFRMMLAF